jgi:ABC-type multidrug transport system fused ATPase/permease subunit
LPKWYFDCSFCDLVFISYDRSILSPPLSHTTIRYTPTAQILLTALSVVLMAYSGVQASLKMHDDAFRNLMRAPMSFFDTTPIGRILNRFSRDQVCGVVPFLCNSQSKRRPKRASLELRMCLIVSTAAFASAMLLDMGFFFISSFLLNHLTCRM